MSVAIEHIAPELVGLRIAQISDLHLGFFLRAGYAEYVVKLIQSEAPDLIVLTGDMVDGVAQDALVAPLGKLVAPLGVYFVTGNHEYYWGAGAWVETFRRLGIVPLMNEHRVLSWHQHPFVLGGVTDANAYRFGPPSSVKKAFHGAPQGLLRILLAHQPKTVIDACKESVHLQLSGHTHGGQIFPLNIALRCITRYIEGLYDHEGVSLYVNPGTGFGGPPFRFMVRSEITVLELAQRGVV